MVGDYAPLPQVAESGLSSPQASSTTKAFLDVRIGGGPKERINLLLYSDDLPLTTDNFKTFATEGVDGMKYSKNTPFHRVIPGFMLQSGDVVHGNGQGGISMYGYKFKDEAFKFRHHGGGVLSMANSGKDTNGSQFFITCKSTPWLDGRHVVFGVVADERSWGVCKAIEDMGSQGGQTKADIRIVGSGVL